ncbi:XRN 5'-3' exonuclease N-terminus family protein [Tritrichomonas foetus]|uniref:XRN 5'-3' exonuclease N-terminus family protein n=1 Tax=Tritrichomonas foetus TaxID=1144522 RepID=A0A1J4J1F1_9EUKA|nr:XRN 5'-3' exonuclease N-terminus family protein [Tritrichomonas foetus]|eukprot:OHS93250.1 XRN 5'-3' exonuclease N-terminus family protein [Tritrichomonas foetus]
MGVPGFYRWLVQRYPLVRRRLNDVSRPKIDNLYIDFNCIIYNALRLASSAYPYTSLLQETCRYLDLLVQCIRPQSVLFIAVDGPAPLAKCAQQRARRFVAARDAVPGGFDTTQISVGTEFMEIMHNFLIQFFEEKTKTDQVWRKPQFIYSSHRSPGEGEHKFFNYIRSQISKGNISPNVTHCVYSPDADLLFLGMQTRQPYFYILREWDGWIGPNENVGNGKLNKLKATDADFELIHLPLVREYFKLDYPEIPDVDRIIDDFAAFSFLIGNDFIPHFPDISISQFETIVATYKASLMRQKRFLIENEKINKKSLQILLNESTKTLTEKNDLYGFIASSNAGSSTYLTMKYPNEYKKNPEKLEKDLAFAILDSFDWVLSYYTQGCQSWTWCFPFFYAPPINIVAKYCTEHVSKFELDRPPYPFEQLLCILPPQSAKNLPAAAQHLMEPTSPLAKYYPRTFEIDLNGHKFEHEGVVLIPLIHVQDVREEFQKVVDQLTEEEVKRNTIIGDILIENGSCRDYDPDKDSISYVPKPPVGVPSLKSAKIQFTYSEENIRVHIFAKSSFAPSIYLHFDQNGYNESIPTKAKDIQYIIDTPILINWPYLRPGLVAQIIDINGNTFPRLPQALTKDKVKNLFDNLIRRYREQYGIDISMSTNIILSVHPLVFSTVNQDRFRFSNQAIYVPFQLTTSIHNAPEFVEKFKYSPPHSPNKEETVIIIDGKFRGRIGKVLSVNNKQVKIQLQPEVSSKLLSQIDTILFEESKEWCDFDTILEKNRISKAQALKLLTSLFVQNEPDANIAFTAVSKGCVLDGYCRLVKSPTNPAFESRKIGKNGKPEKEEKEEKNVLEKNHYEFTNDFIIELGEFLHSSQAGNFLHALQSSINSDPLTSIRANQLFNGSKEEQRNRLAQLLAHLKESICCKYFLIDERIDTISQKSLSRIESLLMEFIKPNEDEGSSLETVIENVDNLLWPGKPREVEQTYEIGSRVINLSNSGTIPFGSCGTVTGIDHQNSLFEVILDNEYPYANTIRKRLETKRGYIAKLDDLYFYL